MLKRSRGRVMGAVMLIPVSAVIFGPRCQQENPEMNASLPLLTSEQQMRSLVGRRVVVEGWPYKPNKGDWWFHAPFYVFEITDPPDQWLVDDAMGRPLKKLRVTATLMRTDPSEMRKWIEQMRKEQKDQKRPRQEKDWQHIEPRESFWLKDITWTVIGDVPEDWCPWDEGQQEEKGKQATLTVFDLGE